MQPATTPEALLSRLEEAARGLLFPSESDFPLTPYRWDVVEPTSEALVAACGLDPEAPVERVTVGELFAPVLELGGEDAARYRRLVDLLEGALSDLRVYRVGRVDIEVHVLGRHASGAWLGLRTRVVET